MMTTAYIPPALLAGDDGPAILPRQCVDLRRALAALGGYFWLPCPSCGFDFAGFEVGKKRVPVPGEPNTSVMCCRWCDVEVRKKGDLFPGSQ